MTREEWLNKANIALTTYIQSQTDIIIPKFYLSVGFPKGGYVGQCWSGKLSDDGLPHIFISPVLDDPIDVLATLGHEIIHTIVPHAGHRVEFSQLAAKCGYTKPWTKSMPNHVLYVHLENLSKRLGEYEHSKLTIPIRGSKGSRLRKYVCDTCGVIVYKGGNPLQAVCKETLTNEFTVHTVCEGSFKLHIKEEII